VRLYYVSFKQKITKVNISLYIETQSSRQ